MPATLQVTHKSIGVEVRRDPYDILVDDSPSGSVAMNDTISIPIPPGTHTLRLRSGKHSSRLQTFQVKEGQTVAYRATGKNLLPIFLASFFIPSLALTLVRTR